MREAHACCCFYVVKTKEAQDCFSSRNHGFLRAAKLRLLLAPSLGNNQGLCLCAFKLVKIANFKSILLAPSCMLLKSSILTAKRLIVTLRLTMLLKFSILTAKRLHEVELEFIQ